MRKTLTGLGLAFFLTLVPATAATAGTPVAQGQTTQSQTAQSQAVQLAPSPQPDDRSDDGGGNGGLWGLLGLLGLLGLAGLRKQRNHVGTAEHVSHHPRH